MRDIRLAGLPVQDYSRAMNSDSHPIADVLLPLALEGPYSYRIPAGIALEEGCYVAVPLGPRTLIGVVWALKRRSEGTKLRASSTVTTCPQGEPPQIRGWLADYYVEPRPMCCAWSYAASRLRRAKANRYRPPPKLRRSAQAPKGLSGRRRLAWPFEWPRLQALEHRHQISPKKGLEAGPLTATKEFSGTRPNSGGFKLPNSSTRRTGTSRRVTSAVPRSCFDGVTGFRKTEFI